MSALAVLAMAALLGTMSVPVSAAQAHDAEHRRITDERAAAKATYAARERVCNQQFVVTSCVEVARREQRAILSRLHREELALDEAERRQAAEARRREVVDRQAAQAARTAAAAAAAPAGSAPPPRDGTRRTSFPEVGTAASSVKLPRSPPAPRASDTLQRAAEARSQAEFEARIRAAQAHREEVERRNAERAAAGKAAQPLPSPNAAASR